MINTIFLSNIILMNLYNKNNSFVMILFTKRFIYISYLFIMKKGHRRTHSQTITISRPIKLQSFEKQGEFQFFKMDPKKTICFDFINNTSNDLFNQNFSHAPNMGLSFGEAYSSDIQMVLLNSQSNITQRVQYIQNLEQPIQSNSSSVSEFSFGKGLNFKINSFRLNMRQIPQVPKSNEQTSLQGQTKMQIQQKQQCFNNFPWQQITIKHKTPKPIKQTRQMRDQKKEDGFKCVGINLKRSKATSIKGVGIYSHKNTDVNTRQNLVTKNKNTFHTHKKTASSLNMHLVEQPIGLAPFKNTVKDLTKQLNRQLYKKIAPTIENVSRNLISDKRKKKSHLI